jgi:LacI family transcriptional regulator
MTKPAHVVLAFDRTLMYSRRVLCGIEQFAQTQPHWMLLCTDVDGFSVRMLKRMRPAGVIAHITTQRFADILQSHACRVVNTSFVLRDVSFPRVGMDNREIGRMAFRHLRDCGLRHFTFVGHPRHHYSLEREAGFREQAIANGFFFDHFHERPVKSYRSSTRLLALCTDFQLWLQRLPKPVGIFGAFDAWALQVIDACRLASLRVPQDVAVIGALNDDVLCNLARPSLSSVIFPFERIGFEAGALLERLLQHGKVPFQPVVFPPVGVIVRQSTDMLAGNDPELTAAVQFIRRHGHQPMEVADVLQVVPVSRRSLERKFRAVLQRGIAQEIRRVHLERAKNLLATTMLSVSDVARQAGFSSVQYLSRTFKQEVGQTPSQFRRQYRP